jgi:hypothetical protein
MSGTQFEESYVAAIGRATAEMAVLENLLGQLQAKVLGVEPKVGQAMYLSSHTAFGRVASLEITAGAAGYSKLDQLKSLTKRARELLQKQNDLPHEIWKSAESAGHVAIHSKALALQVDNVRALAAEVRAAL